MIQFTLSLFRDLYAHQEWADATLWRVLRASSVAQRDDELRERLFHVHLTQRAFLQVWTGQPLDRYQSLRLENLDQVLAWALPFYRDVNGFLSRLDPVRFTEPVPLPWARRYTDILGQAPRDATLGETLFQLISHGTYHRAQVNTRLKALGEAPPMVDYIAWVWTGRPAPAWPS